MIGTFWNLCRACPSMPVDKLHSEYRSTYRWHEFTGSRQEIVRRPPQNTVIGPAAEPALHRRRKHPELAYRAHDFLVMFDGGSGDFLDRAVVYNRARSEERWDVSRQRNSRRSKSEGPPAGQPSYRYYYKKTRQETGSPLLSHRERSGSDPYSNDENAPPADASQDKTVKIEPNVNDKKDGGNVRNGTSEYRFQFAWPPVSRVLRSQMNENVRPRKSISMNGIKVKTALDQETALVHKKITTHKPPTEVDSVGSKRLKANEPEPLNIEEKPLEVKVEPVRKGVTSEYTKKFQPFNNYDFDENKGKFEKKPNPSEIVCNENTEMDSPSSTWYKEVVHLRKKANQYRHRGWGTELVPDHIAQLYTDQIMVWDQVSRRSTLSALSLASTVVNKSSRDKSTSKDEKDKENRKNSPTKSAARSRSTKPSSEVADASDKEDGSLFPQVNEEQLIKSPPEPTRVKSPEQILMRSPEPVNWTVPLDTGKTFTVTQNVREGDILPRSYSEARAWTPTSVPPPASISAPPELLELTQTDVPC